MIHSTSARFFATSFAVALAVPVTADVKLNLANEYQATTFAAVADNFFIDRVADLTDGSVQIDYYPGGSLGFKSIDHFDSVGDGAIEIANTFIGQLSGISPVFSLPSMPFLATSKDKALALEATLSPYYDAVFGDANQMYLFSMPWPPSGIWTHETLDSPAALEGMRVRVADVTSMQTFREAGANPLQISWADVVPQLSANALDAVISSAEGGTNIMLGEFLPHYTAVDYVIPVNVMHMNLDTFESLSEAEQAAIIQAAEDTSDFIWAELEQRLSDTYDDLADLNINVHLNPNAELMATLEAASAGALEEWMSRMGSDGAAILDAYATAAQ
ncbi:TRAP transporter substrate-binding protein [Roseinatronobacter sp. S2]|uniref:TRAP transporter substrate-binding protein n=1 Tax=Roseinatronobacter sp. S2 TaxID=3035471 RepID=UPI00240F97C6|nr:TRAP transporter substrate-binding protein [Roseinatronobacter sp. S2]WFE76607.1 TRAP transporter substrate-binding protein [Roseinatronobacter sp. S2]